LLSELCPLRLKHGTPFRLLEDPSRLALQDLAFEDPNFDANDSVRGARFSQAEVNIRTKRVQGHAALAVGFDSPHLSAAQATGAADADALRTELHCCAESFLHGATEGYAALQLGRDILCD